MGDATNTASEYHNAVQTAVEGCLGGGGVEHAAFELALGACTLRPAMASLKNGVGSIDEEVSKLLLNLNSSKGCSLSDDLRQCAKNIVHGTAIDSALNQRRIPFTTLKTGDYRAKASWHGQFSAVFNSNPSAIDLEMFVFAPPSTEYARNAYQDRIAFAHMVAPNPSSALFGALVLHINEPEFAVRRVSCDNEQKNMWRGRSDFTNRQASTHSRLILGGELQHLHLLDAVLCVLNPELERSLATSELIPEDEIKEGNAPHEPCKQPHTDIHPKHDCFSLARQHLDPELYKEWDTELNSHKEHNNETPTDSIHAQCNSSSNTSDSDDDCEWELPETNTHSGLAEIMAMLARAGKLDLSGGDGDEEDGGEENGPWGLGNGADVPQACRTQ